MSEFRLSTSAAAAVIAMAALTAPAQAAGPLTSQSGTILGGRVVPAIGTSDRAPFDRAWPGKLPPDIDVAAGDPAVSVAYYEVEGDSREELARALKTAGPGLARDGRRTPSITEVEYAVPGDACGDARAPVSYRAVVRLPRLADGVRLSSSGERWWTATTRSLKIHESGRIRLARGYRSELEKNIRSGGCAAADAEADRAHTAFLNASARYDELTGFASR